ncbi:hypothetical protein [Moorena sp. SIO4G3]|uniref:hypothetical protein n=1 Tax=Moorena sp. SIO4G3 TaxID=2607821 RepID=UPI00142BCBC0|nr:hypothetical protein [Moorena sp. SIO4G3]NEO80809.1 hypothetical protein [Moorena sp. SIO4G3]
MAFGHALRSKAGRSPSRSTCNLQPWPLATRFAAKRDEVHRVQPSTLAFGHAIAFNLQPLTFNLQPSTD